MAEACTDEIAEALAVLAEARGRCRDADMRTPEVFAALELLAAHSSVKWPFEQFRRGLSYGKDETGAAAEGRWQTVNASLNAVRRAVGRD